MVNLQNSNNKKKKVCEIWVSFCDFLYLVGIQTIRILKRFRRRFVVFFRPLANFAKYLYQKTIGVKIQKIKKECAALVKTFKGELHSPKKENPVSQSYSIKDYCRGLKAGFFNHKNLLTGFLNVVAPVLCIFLLVATVRYWSNVDYGLQLSYGGEEIGIIQNEKVFERATEMVNERMVYDTATTTNVDLIPTFSIAITDSERYISASAICDKIIEKSSDMIEEASGLYVDGALVGAVKSNADLSYILQNILSVACGEDEQAKASFTQDVEMITGLFPTASIMSSEEMNEKLSENNESETIYVVKEGDTATSIAQEHNLTLGELNNLNGNTIGDYLTAGMELKVKTTESFLGVQVQKKETYQTELPYKTVTQKDDSQYTDYSKVLVEGQNGVQECVDEVTYVNGVEVSRESISRRTITEAVDKQVVVGTKKRPTGSTPGEASGILMWPVPSIHNITSYYEWRWGTMHTGLDISGGNSYGKTIVAADGGTVSYVRYSNVGYGNHLQIDHGNGTSTLYAHTSKILVSSGQKVAKGQPIALIGSTGDSTGAHLHFEVIKNGQKVDPLDYVQN